MRAFKIIARLKKRSCELSHHLKTILLMFYTNRQYYTFYCLLQKKLHHLWKSYTILDGKDGCLFQLWTRNLIQWECFIIHYILTVTLKTRIWIKAWLIISSKIYLTKHLLNFENFEGWTNLVGRPEPEISANEGHGPIWKP